MPSVISLLNQKDGSGKSTLATNLARAFQLDGHSVRILDADPQRTASEWAKLQPKDTPLPSVTATTASDIDADVAQAPNDVLVIDGAPTLDALNRRAVELSDLILIPVRAGGPDVWSGGRLESLIHTRREKTGGRPQAAFVVCQQIARSTVASEIGDVLVGSYPLPVLGGRTSHRAAYAEALSSGTTVLDLPEATSAETEIRQIADESLSLLGADQPNEYATEGAPERREEAQDGTPEEAPAEKESPGDSVRDALLDAETRDAEPTKRLNADVPSGLHRRFKATCRADGQSMTDVVTRLLKTYVELKG